MDLSRIDLIARASDEDLRDERFLEETLIPGLGFNDENLNEQPSVVKNNAGGLKIWQYPNQFAKYMNGVLARYPIESYLEIGCRWGGTFVLTMEYLARIQKKRDIVGVAVDVIDSPVSEYCLRRPETSFVRCDSSSAEFERYMADKHFDLVLIDGDHSYEGVVADFHRVRDKANILVFHDVLNSVCPGVVRCWQEVKQMNLYHTYDFVDQYDEVAAGGYTYLGIGVAVRKTVSTFERT